MNSYILTDAVGCLDKELLTEHLEIKNRLKNKERLKKRKVFFRLIASVACVAIMFGSAALIINKSLENDGANNTTTAANSTSQSGSAKQNGRIYENGKEMPFWEERTSGEKYGIVLSVSDEGNWINYIYDETTIASEKVGAYFGRVYMSGFDVYTNSYRRCEADAYYVIGSRNKIAVRFDGDSEYYLYAIPN